MSNNPLYAIRRQAQERGLLWQQVHDAYREVKALEWEKRERPNEIREHAWVMLTASTPGSWPFWRHGFLSRFGHRLAKGQDYTCIPGYDEIAQEIGWFFPEYSGDDGSERLWDFLLSPYDRYPTREALYRKAFELVEREVRSQARSPATVPF